MTRLETQLAGTTPSTSADQLAQAMPLVHFPANTPIDTWSTDWVGLKSELARGGVAEPGFHAELRQQHVFVYAGPCCFADDPKKLGDAAIYFRAGSERVREGGASPFDSGAVPGGYLQPWAGEPLAGQELLIREHSVSLGGFRSHLASWLSHCYDNPVRYLESTGDRMSDGMPDRGLPPELVEENGARGRTKDPTRPCADRRAWTWEVRIRDELMWDQAAILHVSDEHLETASEWCRLQKELHGVDIEVESLPDTELGCVEALYRHSGRLLAERCGVHSPG